MFEWIAHLFRYLFLGVRNPHKEPDEITADDKREMLLNEKPAAPTPTEDPPPVKSETVVDVPEEEPTPPVELSLSDKIDSLMNVWEPPLESLPKNRAELYKVFGDPGKGKPDKAFQRKNLFVAENLAGEWNGGKHRLYVHKLIEPYLRQALSMTEMILGEVPIEKLGCYNFRHIRHDVANPLSDHSWASAVDFDSADNRSIWRHESWQKKVSGKWRNCPPAQAKRGPVTLPYDRTWISTWPKGLPYEMVRCIIATGLTWGATWSYPHHLWVRLVDKHGVGYDPEKLEGADKREYDHSLAKWQKHDYIDPMHIESRNRQP